jgi:hypothetical protein
MHNEDLAWMLLILTTLLMWVLIEGKAHDAAVLAIIFLSSFKVYLIGVAFMEIFLANQVFKIFFHLWIGLVALMILAFTTLAI